MATIITVLATAINIYFVFKTHSAKRPVVDISVSGLPPYKSKDDLTIITLKNVGTAPTGPNPQVILACSWMPSVSYFLNLPSERYNLDANEQITWRLRLDSRLVPNSTVTIKVVDNRESLFVTRRGIIWERHEHIS